MKIDLRVFLVILHMIKKVKQKNEAKT